MRSLAAGLSITLALLACGGGTTATQKPLDNLGGFPAGGGSGGDVGCDADQDGYEDLACGGPDCNDQDAATHPDAAEACDDKDTDCDGEVAEDCDCLIGDLEACWEGDPNNRDVGACRDGHRRCGPDGTWGPCEDAVVPVAEPEACDGIDQNCDGTGEYCGGCVAGALEICGNGLDDDCNGAIDDSTYCTLDCSEVDSRAPGVGPLACCGDAPPRPYSHACAEWPGNLAACNTDNRKCYDLDDQAATICAKVCSARGCFCGRPAVGGIGDPTPVADCGFVTACSRMDCDGRQHQPCYGGAPVTLGVGICHGGFHDCKEEGGGSEWTTCEGQQLPQSELCGNDLDDDCDGKIDENDGLTGKSCGPRRVCAEGALEVCGNDLDDDCDGFVDEACVAPAGGRKACWSGTLLDRGVGACHDGQQSENAGTWGTCNGEGFPDWETCGDGVDSDCNGLGGPDAKEDASCCIAAAETCNDQDDDCDGLVDDGVLTHCGTCSGTCFELDIDDLTSCTAPGRTCEQIAPFLLDPAAITLGPPEIPPRRDVIHMAEQRTSMFGFGPLTLIDVNAATVTVTRTMDANTSANLRGIATVLDGSYWLAFNARPGWIEHRSESGTLICKYEIDGAQYITADLSGDVWMVRDQDGDFDHWLRRFSGSLLGSIHDGIPECVTMDLRPDRNDMTEVGLSIVGRPVIDANGFMWIPDRMDGNPILRVDTVHPMDVQTLDIPVSGASAVAVVGPDEAVYTAGTSANYRRVDVYAGMDGEENFVAGFNVPRVRSLDVAADGTVWAALQNGGGFGNPPAAALIHLDPRNGKELDRQAPPADGAGNDVMIDESGLPWITVDDEVLRWDTTGRSFNSIERIDRLWLHPGSTIAPLRELQKRQGRWTQDIDPGVYNVKWGTLEWSSSAPAHTRVLTYMRFGDTIQELEDGKFVCGPMEVSPAVLTSCSGGRRFARLEFLLSGAGSPAVGSARVTWDRQ